MRTDIFAAESTLKLCTGSPSVAGYSSDPRGEVWGPALWTDETQPRTDRPAVFYLSKLGAPCPHIVRPPAGFLRVTSPR